MVLDAAALPELPGAGGIAAGSGGGHGAGSGGAIAGMPPVLGALNAKVASFRESTVFSCFSLESFIDQLPKNRAGQVSWLVVCSWQVGTVRVIVRLFGRFVGHSSLTRFGLVCARMSFAVPARCPLPCLRSCSRAAHLRRWRREEQADGRERELLYNQAREWIDNRNAAGQ